MEDGYLKDFILLGLTAGLIYATIQILIECKSLCVLIERDGKEKRETGMMKFFNKDNNNNRLEEWVKNFSRGLQGMFEHFTKIQP